MKSIVASESEIIHRVVARSWSLSVAPEDKDWLANIADQMADPSMSNAVAVFLANPGHPDAERLKAAVGLKNAPKTSWKELCLSNWGGSSDRLRAFLAD